MLTFPRRTVQCPHCLYRFDADSDVLIFFLFGVLVGIFVALAAF